jgi:hypothetical protein
MFVQQLSALNISRCRKPFPELTQEVVAPSDVLLLLTVFDQTA